MGRSALRSRGLLPPAARPRLLALLAVLSLAGGLGACGADDEPSSDIPRTSPDLTIPTATTRLPADTTTNATTTATDTSTLQQAPAPAVVTPPPVVAPPVAPPASTTGGAAAAPTGGQQTTGGAQPGDADFQNFCRENGNAPEGC